MYKYIYCSIFVPVKDRRQPQFPFIEDYAIIVDPSWNIVQLINVGAFYVMVRKVGSTFPVE